MSALEELAEKVLQFVTVYKEQREDMSKRIEKMEKNTCLRRSAKVGGHPNETSIEMDYDLVVALEKTFQLDRLKKMEEALSEEMAKVREMDGILAGVVKDVERLKWRQERADAATLFHRESAIPAPLDQKTLDDIVASPGDYTVKLSPVPDWVEPAPADDFKADLLKWLDAEIAMVKENFEQARSKNAGIEVVCSMHSMLATYRAVKAHIEG